MVAIGAGLMKKFNHYYIIFSSLVIFYISFLLIRPYSSAAFARYSLDPSQARLLNILVAVPYVIIWFCAFYGVVKIKQYAFVIKDAKEGRAFNLIANGLYLLALYFPITSIINLLKTFVFIRRPLLIPSGTIITNYVGLAIVFGAFSLILLGSKHLVSTLNKVSVKHSRLGMLIFGAFCLVFAYLTLTNPSRQFPTANSKIAAYYLPDWLLALTIVIPFILVWLMGYLSAHYISVFRSSTTGIIYQKAMGYIAGGVGAILGSIMLIRTLSSMTGFFSSLELRMLLVVIYMLLIIISMGFLLVAKGANRLKKIEQV